MANTLTGKDGRQWRLILWEVIYGEGEPLPASLAYSNCVPADEDPATYLEKEYGPFSIGPMRGHVYVHGDDNGSE